ncbi:MAG TPA: hypothetical protein VNA20_11365 [Frankiaceae bacterium]|nr:hypothetical protein [Frankiaceae bacterium]
MTPYLRSALAVGAAALAVATGGVVAVARHAPPAIPPAAAPSVTPPSPAPASPTPFARTRRPMASPAPAVRPLYPLPAPPADPRGCPPPKRSGGGQTYKPWRPSEVVRESDLPAPLAPITRTPSLDALRGKGMWTYEWERTEGGSAQAVVARARAAGLRQIWVRTGSSKSGFYAAPELRRLLPLAHAAGIKVVAWDFPYLYDPVADYRRAAATLAFSVDGHRIDAFSPDIESPSEGTQLTRRRLAVYLGLLQRAADERPIVSTVPPANPHWLRTYDYKTQAPYVDAFAVMTYWNCNEPGFEVARSVSRLAAYGKPLHVIGQAFDMGPYGGRRGDPTGREVWRFADVAQRRGVLGVSLYVWQHATAEQFRALGAYPWR